MIREEKELLTKKLKRKGFKNFKLLCENELPIDIESEFQYIIDVLPYRLEIENEKYYSSTVNNEIPRTSFNDLEDFYYSKKEMNNLNSKKIRILYKMAYYYELQSIVVYASLKGIGSAKGSKDYYMSIEPMCVMKNIKKFLALVRRTMHTSSFSFHFTDGVTIVLDLTEIYTGIYCNENVNEEIIGNIFALVNSEGLFLTEC